MLGFLPLTWFLIRLPDETNTMKQTFEKIKEQIAPTRLQEIDTTISNLRRLLKEKDKEITELSRLLCSTPRNYYCRIFVSGRLG